jgi:hypothetical protein
MGYAVNFSLHFFYHFYSYHGASTIDLHGIFSQKLGDIVYNFILFLGYTPDAKFMSPPGILNFITVVVFFIIFYEAGRIVKQNYGLNKFKMDVFFMLFFIVTTAYHIILFQILDEDPMTWHFIPVQVLYIPALAVIFEFIKKTMPLRKAMSFISVISFVILCNGTIRLHALPWYDVTSYRKSSISYLDKNNLRFGFATFWNANVITELTDGRIEMLGLDNNDFHNIHSWLYPIAYENPSYYIGETFLLLTLDEWKTIPDEKLSLRQPDYVDDNFVIFKYPSTPMIFQELITGK